MSDVTPTVCNYRLVSPFTIDSTGTVKWSDLSFISSPTTFLSSLGFFLATPCQHGALYTSPSALLRPMTMQNKMRCKKIAWQQFKETYFLTFPACL